MARVEVEGDGYFKKIESGVDQESMGGRWGVRCKPGLGGDGYAKNQNQAFDCECKGEG